MKIYAASSWRNLHFKNVVSSMRMLGHEVYDFREAAFSWKDVDPTIGELVDVKRLQSLLDTTVARDGFVSDMQALQRCQAVVLILPCGRSAHLEAGWAVGAGRPVVVYAPEPCQPELMYLMTEGLVTSVTALAVKLGELSKK